MSRVQIRDNYFIKNGKPFFYQGDTLWMAFSKMQPAEWRELLRARRAQRFTVAQISVLPITHDNAASEQDLHPFALGADGRYDFDMTSKRYMRPEIAEGEQLTLLMPPCMGDVLYILTPKNKA